LPAKPTAMPPHGAAALPALNPMDAWTAAARIAPLLQLTAARDDDPSLRLAEVLDRSLHYAMSRLTLGLSPMALAETYFDWLIHLSLSPGKQLQLWQKGMRKGTRLASHVARCMTQLGEDAQPCICPLPQDRRFESAEWHKWPFNVIHQSFLLQQQWWHNATTGIRGVSAQHERALEFASRQVLDVLSPSNFLLTNPDALKRTQSEGGQNLVRGFWNFILAWRRGDARQGRLSQQADRAHSISADDDADAAGADPDRARLDHEVLHPRPERP